MAENRWQLAVVDWDLWKKNLPSNAAVLEEIDKVEHDDSGNTLQSGEVVYICSVDHVDFRGKYGLNYVAIADVWVPSKRRYTKNVLYSLWPILSARDAIEVNLKFGLSLCVEGKEQEA